MKQTEEDSNLRPQAQPHLIFLVYYVEIIKTKYKPNDSPFTTY
jgi:hypothetical protein